ncbi:MAG: photosynthetic reaction center cytochrome c subunit family protein [Gemmatimonadaceae bacterium]
MQRFRPWIWLLGGAAIVSCTSAPSSHAPAPQPSSAAQPVHASPPVREGQAGPPPEGQRGPGRPEATPRRAPNPVVQDSLRRAQVDSILATIRGREQQPAGTVFKNVKLLKDMPAAEFLKNMDVTYGRGLGMACGNCHVIGQYDADTRKNKRIAREMQALTDYINSERLPKIKDLDEDYPKASCVTCHAGSSHTRNTMAVPVPGAPPPR